LAGGSWFSIGGGVPGVGLHRRPRAPAEQQASNMFGGARGREKSLSCWTQGGTPATAPGPGVEVSSVRPRPGSSDGHPGAPHRPRPGSQGRSRGIAYGRGKASTSGLGSADVVGFRLGWPGGAGTSRRRAAPPIAVTSGRSTGRRQGVDAWGARGRPPRLTPGAGRSPGQKKRGVMGGKSARVRAIHSGPGLTETAERKGPAGC